MDYLTIKFQGIEKTIATVNFWISDFGLFTRSLAKSDESIKNGLLVVAAFFFQRDFRLSMKRKKDGLKLW